MIETCARKALCLLVTLALAWMVPAGAAFADTSGSASGGRLTGAQASEGAFTAQASASGSLSAQAGASGWKRTSAGLVYYRKGEKATGLQKVGSSYYYFGADGVLKTTNVEVSGATFFIRSNGKIYGAKYGNQYYYANLKPMTGADNFDFDTYIWAGAIVDSITDPGDSKEDKLWEAFCFVRDKSYAIHQDFNPYQENWPAVYARYHFANEGGDCHSDGAAFAYLAAAIGYPAYVYTDNMASGYAPSHCWTMIDGAVYDPLFYESKGSQYFGAWGTYQNNVDLPHWRVPQYDEGHNSGAAVARELLEAGSIGLKYAHGAYYYVENGAKVKNAWRTIDGKRYYFMPNGAAATGARKIGGVYYVFSETGALQTSAKAGKRIVTVGKAEYQVLPSGKAAAGWARGGKSLAYANGMLLKNKWATVKGKRYYFLSDGMRATSSVNIGGTFYVFDKAGVLQKGKKAKKTTLVTVGKDTYRVDKAGKAVKGWAYNGAGAKSQRFVKTGRLLTGIWFIQGRFYACSKQGAYSASASKRLNKAIRGMNKKKVSAVALRRALDAAHAKLKSEVYSPSCDIKGDDGLWEYEHFVVMTARPTAVNELYKDCGYKTIEDLMAAEDAAAKAAKEAKAAEDAAAKAAEEAAASQDASAVTPQAKDTAEFEYVRSITAR